MIKITSKTIDIIEELLDEGLASDDIAIIVTNDFIIEALENETDFEIYNSVREFGKENSDNDLYEDDEDFESFGYFLLSVPGAWENLKLPSGKVFFLNK